MRRRFSDVRGNLQRVANMTDAVLAERVADDQPIGAGEPEHAEHDLE